MYKFKVGDRVKANRSVVICSSFVGEVGVVTGVHPTPDNLGQPILEVKYPCGATQTVWASDDELELVTDGEEQDGFVTLYATDNVSNPKHYNTSSIECIQAIKAMLTEEEFRGYTKGNALKYLWRERYKNGDEDLQKAEWYLGYLNQGNRK